MNTRRITDRTCDNCKFKNQNELVRPIWDCSLGFNTLIISADSQVCDRWSRIQVSKLANHIFLKGVEFGRMNNIFIAVDEEKRVREIIENWSKIK